MLILIKPGVSILRVDDPFLYFCSACEIVWQKWGDTPTITSGNDGKHDEHSKHYKGLAWDLRIWGLHDPATMAKQLQDELNDEDRSFLVLYGDEKHTDHIHVQVNRWDNHPV